MMKKTLSSGLFALLILSSQAQIPATLSYQGLLTNASGVPVADGNHTVLFKFYTAPSGGSPVFTRGTLSVSTFKGLFTSILGNGQGSNNDPLPSTLGDTQYYIGIEADGGAELSPRITLTAVPYAFVANNVKTVDATTISTGTVPDARLSTHIQDLADGELTGSKVGAGINANNITTGTVPDARLSTHLQDVADGTLSGSKVGTGINATNITTGTLSGSLVGTGINASNITTGTISTPTISLTGTGASKLATGTTAERPSSPVEGQIRYNSTEKVMEYFNGTGWYFLVPKVAYLKDTKANGTQGGNATSGSFRTRDLNTLEGDVSFISLSANQFTLTPGEYIIEGSSPMVAVSRYKIIIYDFSNDAVVINGTGGFLHPSNSDVAGRAELMGKVTITTSTVFEVRYYCSTGYSSWGLGSSGNSGISEIYTQVKITKLK